MEKFKVSPVVAAVLTGLLSFAICVGFDYLKDVVIDGGTFAPSMLQHAIVGVAVGIITFVGPDAAQRKRNRQELKNKFTGKN